MIMCSEYRLPFVFPAKCTQEIKLLTSYGMHIAHDQSKYLLHVKESLVCGPLTEKQAQTSPVGLLTSDINLARAILLWQTSQGNSLWRGMEGA